MTLLVGRPPRRAAGGYDAGAQMNAYYAEGRASFPFMPQWCEILEDVPGIEAETRGLNVAGFVRFAVGDEYVLPRGTGLHEFTHGLRLILNKIRGDEVLRPYLAFRDFGLTLEQARLEQTRATSPSQAWQLDPSESFAEAGRIALTGGGSEKTMNYGKEIDPPKMLAFLKSLGPAPPAPVVVPPPMWNDGPAIAGRCPFAVWDPSPNYSSGWVQQVEGTMQHSTASPFTSALATLKNGNAGTARVSAHFIIRKSDGLIKQLVSLNDRSWAQRDCNETHWSIEHDDDGDHADPVRTPALYASSARLNWWLAREGGYPIDAAHLPPHRSCVNTACPSGLDLERIIREAQGGVMAFDPFNNAADLAKLDKRIRDIVLGEPALTGYAIGRIVGKFGGGAAPLAARKGTTKLAKTPTRAQVRVGHGATAAQRAAAGRK